MRIIFVPTIQHTGTWFTLRFLEHYIPNICEVWKVLKENRPVQSPAILHTHFPVVDSFSLPNKKSLPLDSIYTLANLYQTIIPVRDPFAAILTRECRHPEYRHFYIVDGFVNMIERFGEHPNVYFLPIDLYTDKLCRMEVLKSVLKHCSIDIDDFVNETAENWPVHNPTPGHRFKQLYQDKKWSEIQLLLGPKNAEIEYLKNKASIIKPFMKKIGYTELWP